jgi:hypothetical protein
MVTPHSDRNRGGSKLDPHASKAANEIKALLAYSHPSGLRILKEARAKDRTNAPVVEPTLRLLRTIQNSFGKTTANRTESLEALERLVSKHGAVRVRLAADMVSAVAVREVREIPALLNKMVDYPHSIGVLRRFFEALGSADPVVAFKRAQLKILKMDEIPASMLVFADREGEHDVALPSRSNAKSTYQVGGAAGGRLKGTATDLVYQLLDPTNPTTQLFFSRAEAFDHLVESWAPQRLAEMEAERVEGESRFKSEFYAVLDEILDRQGSTASTADTDSTALKRRGSWIRADRAEVYDYLQKEISTARATLQALLLTSRYEEIADPISHLQSEPGGGTRQWYVKRWETIPEELRTAFNLFFFPRTERVEPTEQAYLLKGLLAYMLSNEYINTRISLGPIARDVEWYRAFEVHHPEHPLLSVLGEVDDGRLVRFNEVLHSGKKEIPLAEFGPLLLSFPFTTLRREANRLRLEKYGEAFEAAYDFMRRLLRTNSQGASRWIDDPPTPTTAFARLQESSRYFQEVGSPKGPVITRGELSAIFPLMRAYEFHRNELDCFLPSIEINEFQNMMIALIRAHRKAEYFDRQIPEGKKVTTKSVRLIKGVRSLPVEEFELTFGMSFPEFQKRMTDAVRGQGREDRRLHMGTFQRRFGNPIALHSPAKLLPLFDRSDALATLQAYATVVAEARILVPADTVIGRAQAEAVLAALRSPLMSRPPNVTMHLLGYEYFTPRERAIVERERQALDAIYTAWQTVGDTENAQRIYRELEQLRFVGGSLTDPYENVRERTGFSLPVTESEGMRVYTLRELETTRDRATSELVYQDTFSELVKRRLDFIFSFYSTELLPELGLPKRSSSEWEQVRRTLSGDVWTTALRDEVAVLMPKFGNWDQLHARLQRIQSEAGHELRRYFFWGRHEEKLFLSKDFTRGELIEVHSVRGETIRHQLVRKRTTPQVIKDLFETLQNQGKIRFYEAIKEAYPYGQAGAAWQDALFPN